MQANSLHARLHEAESRDRKAAWVSRQSTDLRAASIATALRGFWEDLHDVDRDFAYRGQAHVEAALAARESLERMLLAIADDLRWDCAPGTYALNTPTSNIIDALVLDAVRRAIVR